ncbi:hypothetical protein BACERE00193_00152 [Bacillus paranthracis]|nr:hypothetical protein BACERE00193_00152 [Bacillus paranthracis]
MNELLLSIKKFLGNDENVLAFVVGVFEKDHFTLCYQHGIFVATTRRLLFYGKFPYYLSTFKEYSYLHIDSIVFPRISNLFVIMKPSELSIFRRGMWSNLSV